MPQGPNFGQQAQPRDRCGWQAICRPFLEISFPRNRSADSEQIPGSNAGILTLKPDNNTAPYLLRK
jgi:hypothetical protein